MRDVHGSCLCGETKLTVNRLGNEITACHCSMCRKQTAGPIFYTEEVAFNQIHFNQEETISIFRSSEWAERGFCNQCGTFLFYRYQKEKQAYLNAELFEELTAEALFNEEIFYADKPDYYDFANETNKEA